LDIEFDFSQTIFICTSNSIANMLAPLIDRIEVINVPAYLPIEKLNIGKQYLVPSLESEYGFKTQEVAEVIETAASATVATEEPVVQEEKVEIVAANERVELTDAAMMDIITHYCGHEAGVRNLRKCLDRVFRKIVAKIETKEVTHADEVEYQINT